MTALANGKRPVVVPRLRRFGEAVDDHQLQLGHRLHDAGLVTLVERPEDVRAALDAAEDDAPVVELGPDRRLVEELRDYVRTHARGRPAGPAPREPAGGSRPRRVHRRQPGQDALPAHRLRRIDSEQLEHRRRDVEEMGVHAAGRPGSGPGEDEQPLLRVVGVVGTGVVLEGVYAFVAADRADGAPEQVSEVHDQVGSDAADVAGRPPPGLKTFVPIGRPCSSGIAASRSARSSRTRS